MKRSTILLILLLYNSLLFAQPARDWVSYLSGHYTLISGVHYDDKCDCIYISGTTGDTFGISTPGAHKELFGEYADIPLGVYTDSYNSDNFLIKMSRDGAVIWGTYYGGSDKQSKCMVTTDRSGNPYITGITHLGLGGSSLEPSKYYIAKFSPEGTLLWDKEITPDDGTDNPFIGGHIPDVDFDADNNVYFTGTIGASGFGTTGTHKPQLSIPDTFYTASSYPLISITDAILVKYDSNGVKQWGTYFGGGKREFASRVLCTDDGGVYLSGYTNSDTGIAYNSAYQDEIDTFMRTSSYLARFDVEGQLDWSTYITGNGSIDVGDIQSDDLGDIYLFGHTASETNIATEGAYQMSHGGGYSDMFLMKFSAEGEKLWGTYMGGAGIEPKSYDAAYYSFNGLAVNKNNGDVFFGGETSSTEGLATACSYDTEYNKKGLLSKFSGDGTMQWISYYDTEIGDISINAKEDITRDIFIVSCTNQNGLATAGAHQETKPLAGRSGLVGRFTDDYDCGSDTLLVHQEENILFTTDDFDTYQWYHNTEMISESDTALTITDSTGYYYLVATKCGCTFISDTFYFGGLGIDPELKSGTLAVYPNPVQDELQIDLSKIGTSILGMQLEIVNVLGQSVYTEQLKTKNLAIYRLPISFLKSGMYSISLRSEQGVFMGKFVKL